MPWPLTPARSDEVLILDAGEVLDTGEALKAKKYPVVDIKARAPGRTGARHLWPVVNGAYLDGAEHRKFVASFGSPVPLYCAISG